MSAWLFVPGTRPDRFATAHGAGASAVVLDLEDAVAPADKDAARRHVVDAVGRESAPRSWVRVNGATSEWFDLDLTALSDAPALAGVVLAKAEHPQDVRSVRERLGVPVVPLVESVLGVRNSEQLASEPGVRTLAFGGLDYALDLGADPGAQACRTARWHVVQAARLAGREGPVDGVTPEFRDDELVSAAARESRDEGCGGKLCIHPRQVPLVTAAFAPSREEVRWAERVIAAAGDGGAAAVDGRMVDAPVLTRARHILDRAVPT